MKKKYAISIIKKRIIELDTLEPHVFGEWCFRTTSIVEKMLKPGTNEYYRIQEIAASGLRRYGSESMDTALERTRKDYKNRLGEALENVEVYGPHFKGAPNYLSRLSDGWVTFLLSFLLGGGITGGVMYGQYLSDVKNYQLTIDKSILISRADSLSDALAKAKQEAEAYRSQAQQPDSTMKEKK